MVRSQKQLVLHIGFHKTGTSALQEALFYNRKQLEELGLVYPQPLSTFQSHLELAHTLFPEEMPWVSETFEFEQVYDHYVGVVNTAPAGSTIVLSTEELCRVDGRTVLAEKILTKFQGLEDTDIKVLAYSRDPIGFLISLYHHRVRQDSFAQDFETFVRETVNLNSVRFEKRLHSWKQVFGAENVVLRNYDDVVNQKGNAGIVQDVLEVLNVGSVSLPEAEKRVNIGLHPWLIEAYRQLGTVTLDPQKRSQLKSQLIRIGDEIPQVNAAEYYLGAEKLEALRAEIEANE